jgi:hypothetical protein
MAANTLNLVEYGTGHFTVEATKFIKRFQIRRVDGFCKSAPRFSSNPKEDRAGRNRVVPDFEQRWLLCWSLAA